MQTEEVTAYGGAAEVIHIYSGLQKEAQTEETGSKAFFSAHPHPTPQQMEDGAERLLLFSRAEEALAFVGPQMKTEIEKALAAARR